MKYQSTVVSPIRLNGVVIERVPNYKLLGVIISQDPRTAICLVKKAVLNCEDLVLVHCSLVTLVIEYASPVWAALYHT